MSTRQLQRASSISETPSLTKSSKESILRLEHAAAERRRRQWLHFVDFCITMLFVCFAMVFLASKDEELLRQVFQMVATLVGGIGIGYGLRITTPP